MKIQSIAISNFLTIGDAKIELDDRGLLLIQGVNGDDPSAESNGAGKSSVVDALCWGIFGTTARGVTGDAVVNKTAKKDCCVHTTMIEGDKQYRIVRWRKGSTYKNSLMVYEKDLTSGAEADLSKGTDKETQEVVNKLMGCSLDVFMAAVYAGQECMPDLPGMTDKQLKLLIEEAAGVEVLSEAYAEARSRHIAAKSRLDGVVAEQAKAINDKTRLDAELVGQGIQSNAFEDGRRDRAKAELAKVLPVQKQIAEAEEALKAWDEPAARKELDEIEVKIKAHDAEKAELRRLENESYEAEKVVALGRSALTTKKRDLEIAETELKSIESQIGKPCGECGKTYCEHDLEAARQARSESIAALKASMVPMVTELRKKIAAMEEAAEKAGVFAKGMTDITAAATRQRELSNLLNAIDAAKRKVEGLKKDVETIKAAANAKLSETNPWTKAIEAKKAEVERNDDLILKLNEKVEEQGAEVELLANAVKVFGPAGVRAHILDTVTPYLNDRTREYLGALADGNIHATWATLAKTAKGDLKEKFNIDVTNDKGAESFAGLSGGEKRKVRLATAMALQDMVASRATKPIEIFIADEVDHALDESGLERLMGVLERKARERGTVLVISHNSLSDWIDNVITVTKSGGKATVSGATERGF
jgi:DNA repair exonuclease SbcCD ATPase subunit